MQERVPAKQDWEMAYRNDCTRLRRGMRDDQLESGWGSPTRVFGVLQHREASAAYSSGVS